MTARRWSGGLVVVIALSLLASAWFGSGSESAPVAAQADRRERPTVFVDQQSDRCTDMRSPGAVNSETPWCTLSKGVRAAPAGGLVIVRGGPYPRLVIPASVRMRRLTVRADPPSREPVVLDGVTTSAGGVRVEGFRLTGGAEISAGTRGTTIAGNDIGPGGVVIQEGTRDTRIVDNRISAPKNNGVTLSASPRDPEIHAVTISRNHFKDIGRDAIQAKRFDDLVIEGNEIEGVVRHRPEEHSDALQTIFGGTDLVFRGNVIHDSAAGVLIKDGHVDGVLIANNVIVRNRLVWAIMIFDASNVRLLHNTVWDSQYGVILREGVRGAVIANNILQSLKVEEAEALVYEDYNLIGLGERLGVHDVAGPPRFVAPTAIDYRLGARSAGIDAGTSRFGPSSDRRGGARRDDPAVPNRGGGEQPWHDLGAYERQPPRPK